MTRHTTVALLERLRERWHPLHMLRRISPLRALARSGDVEIWAHVHGIPHPVRLYALRNSSYLFNRRSPEPRIAALVRAVLDTCPIGTFWDVGANIGYYSWLVHARSPQSRVVAIEPDTVNFGLLQQTRRHAPDVELLNIAVSRIDGEAGFLVDSVSGATGTLELSTQTYNERHYAATRESMRVATRSLDSLALSRGMPDLLKIDVEGHEAAVLEGATRVLASAPTMLIETFNPRSAVLEMLRDAGLQVLAADSLTDSTPRDGNYLALPREGLGRLADLRQAHRQHLVSLGFGTDA